MTGHFLKRSCIWLGLLAGLSALDACGSGDDGPMFTDSDGGGSGGSTPSLDPDASASGSGGRSAAGSGGEESGGSGGRAGGGGDAGTPPVGEGGPGGVGPEAGAGGTGMGGTGGLDAGGEACVNSLDCAMNPGGRTICDTAAGQCVECLSPTDCMGTADCTDHTCVPYAPCVSSTDCASNPDGKTTCDTTAERCVECVGDTDCMMGEVCVDQTCRTGCDSDNDCTPQGLLCFQSGGFCVQCLREQDCGPAESCVRGTCASDEPPPPDGGLPRMCQDGALNGDETDVDCGGTTCPTCAGGQACVADDDCASGTCRQNVCEAAACVPNMCPQCFPSTRCCTAAGACGCSVLLGCI